MGSHTRRVRHIASLQIRNLYTGQLHDPCGSKFWFTLEAGESESGPWQHYHTSDKVHGDLELLWGPVAKAKTAGPCDRCEAPGALAWPAHQPASAYPGTSALTSQGGVGGVTATSPGQCQRVRLTVLSSSPSVPTSHLQGKRVHRRAAGQQHKQHPPPPPQQLQQQQLHGQPPQGALQQCATPAANGCDQGSQACKAPTQLAWLEQVQQQQAQQQQEAPPSHTGGHKQVQQQQEPPSPTAWPEQSQHEQTTAGINGSTPLLANGHASTSGGSTPPGGTGTHRVPDTSPPQGDVVSTVRLRITAVQGSQQLLAALGAVDPAQGSRAVRVRITAADSCTAGTAAAHDPRAVHVQIIATDSCAAEEDASAQDPCAVHVQITAADSCAAEAIPYPTASEQTAPAADGCVAHAAGMPTRACRVPDVQQAACAGHADAQVYAQGSHAGPSGDLVHVVILASEAGDSCTLRLQLRPSIPSAVSKSTDFGNDTTGHQQGQQLQQAEKQQQAEQQQQDQQEQQGQQQQEADPGTPALPITTGCIHPPIPQEPASSQSALPPSPTSLGHPEQIIPAATAAPPAQYAAPAAQPIHQDDLPELQHVSQGPYVPVSNPQEEEEGQVLFQLQFSTTDLVTIDLTALERYAKGVNHMVLYLPDGSTCIPIHAHILTGLTFLVPLPLLRHVAVEPLPRGAHGESHGPQLHSSASMPELPEAAKEAAGQGSLLDVQQQLLCRWMVDNGSVIAPLGAAHSLDADSAAALLTPAGAAQLVGEAAGGMAGAASQGFMPAMMAMLFGPASVTQVPSPPPSRTSSPAPLPRRRLSATSLVPTGTPTLQPQGPSTLHPHGPPALQPHGPHTLHPHGPSTLAPHGPSTLQPQGPSAPLPAKPNNAAAASNGHSTSLSGSAGSLLLLPPPPPPSSSPPIAPGHRRSASATTFPASLSPFAPLPAPPPPLSRLHHASHPRGPASNDGSSAGISPAAVHARRPPATTAAGASRASASGALVGAAAPPAGPGAGRGVPAARQGRDGLQGGLHGGGPAGGSPGGAGRGERVYDVEDLQASTRRLMGTHQRLCGVCATRTRMQRQVMQVMDAGSTARTQQQALEAAHLELSDLAHRTAAVQQQAQALRRLADETQEQLQRRCREQQAASRQLKAAQQRLRAAEAALAGPEGWGSWRAVHSIVAGRVNMLVAGLAAAYELGPRGASIRLATASPLAMALSGRSPTLARAPSGGPAPTPFAHASGAAAAAAAAAGAGVTGAIDGGAWGAAGRRDGNGNGSGRGGGSGGGAGRRAAGGAGGPSHRPTPSLEEVLAAQPLELRMDASWWAAGAGEVCSEGSLGSDDSCDSSADLDDIIQRVLTGPTPASRNSLAGFPGTTSGSTSGRISGQYQDIPGLAGVGGPPAGGAAGGYAGGVGGAGGGLWGAAAAGWGGGAGRQHGEVVPVCVLGLELPANLAKRSLEGSVGWGSSPDEEQRVAAALGYVAHMVDRLSHYMDVPLRYPVLPAMSKSHIWDPCPVTVVTQPTTGGLLQRSLGRLLGPYTTSNTPTAHTSPELPGASPAQWLLGGLPTGLLHAPPAPSPPRQHTIHPAPPSNPPSSTPGGGGNALAAATDARSGRPPAALASKVGSSGRNLGSPNTTIGSALLAGAGAGASGGALPPAGSHAAAGVPPPTLLPLYSDGRDRTRFAYAVYLLNKDVEILMQAHGLASLGPNQLLRNLYILALAAVSAVS